MNLSYIFYTSIIALTVMLSSCGGGGGSGGNAPNNIVASSAQSSSSEPPIAEPPVAIAPDNQTFTLDEDAIFYGEISSHLNDIIVSGSHGTFSRVIHTVNGGLVTLADGAYKPTKTRFNYRPAEDFNGEDEGRVYVKK